MSNLSNDLVSYIKIYKVKVDIDSELLNDIGVFEKFCFKALISNLSIEQISDITQLREDIIKERIDFLFKHGYILYDNNKVSFTKLGQNVIKHMTLIDYYKKNTMYLALDSFVDSDKEIYLFSQIETFLIKDVPSNKDILFPSNISEYKIDFDNVYDNEIKGKVKSIISEKFTDFDLNKILINYDVEKYYFLRLDIDFKKLKFSKDENYDLLMPCLDRELKVIFPELNWISKEEQDLLLNLSFPTLKDKNSFYTSILSSLKDKYLLKEDDIYYYSTDNSTKLKDIIIWNKKYKLDPIIILTNLVSGKEINRSSITNIIKNKNDKKTIASKIKDIDDNVSSHKLLSDWSFKNNLYFPNDLFSEKKIEFTSKTIFLPVVIDKNYIQDKIFEVLNLKCRYCNGTQEIPCEKCNKTGILKEKEDCNRCNGKGNFIAECKKCSGTGSDYRTCNKCNGSGNFDLECNRCKGRGNFTVDCRKCSGSGSFRGGTCFSCDGCGTKTLDCKICEGSGFKNLTCRRCNGSGSIDECFSCKGTGQISLECRSCNGLGYYPEITCKKCDGSGFVECNNCSKNNKNNHGVTYEAYKYF